MDVTYPIIMNAVAVFLLLLLIILMEVKLARISRKLDNIAKSAQDFVKLGLSHFKIANKKKK